MCCTTGSSQNPSLQAHPILPSQHLCHNMRFFLNCSHASSAAMVILEMRVYVWIGLAFLQLLYHSFKMLPCSARPGLSGTIANCFVKLASWKSNSYPPKVQTDNYGWSLNGSSSQTVPEIAWWSSVCPKANLCQGLCKSYTQWTIEIQSWCHLGFWSYM